TFPEAATPMSVETNIPELDRPKKESCISDRCCAPHPPCIDLIDPPGHPLSGRAHFWARRRAVGRAKIACRGDSSCAISRSDFARAVPQMESFDRVGYAPAHSRMELTSYRARCPPYGLSGLNHAADFFAS